MTTEKEADCCAFHPVYLVNPVSLSFCSYTLRFALTARREVADACGDAHGWIEGLDLHPTELAVARFVELAGGDQSGAKGSGVNHASVEHPGQTHIGGPDSLGRDLFANGRA